MRADVRPRRFGRHVKAALAVAVGLAVGVLAILGSRPAAARQSGITGYSGNPGTNQGATCTTCHTGGTRPNVTLDGPRTVLVGATHRYTLTITGGQRSAGGLDVSVTGGRLDTLPGARDVQVIEEEVTHTEPKRSERGQGVVFAFRWTAPAVPGRTRMYAAGNSVNLNGMPSGDAPDTDDLAIVVVTAGPTTPPATSSVTPTGTEAVTATVTATESPTAAPTETTAPTASATPTVPTATATAAPPTPTPEGRRVYLPLTGNGARLR